MKSIPFEKLKIPCQSGIYKAVSIDTAKAIFEQMRDHYEGPKKREPVEGGEFVELSPADFPPGTLIRQIGYEAEWVSAKPFGEGYIYLMPKSGTDCALRLSFSVLAERFEMKSPGSSVWSLCRKED